MPDGCKRKLFHVVSGACAVKASHARPLVRERLVGESAGVPTSALIAYVARLYAYVRMAPALPPVAHRDRGALPPYQHVLGANRVRGGGLR